MATEPTPTSVTNLLERLGILRDGLLVLVSAIYLLGYVTWSIISWRNGMGPLPLLDAQYLIAGVAPALVLSATVAATWLIRLLVFVRWPGWLNRQKNSVVVIIHAGLVMFIGTGMFILHSTPAEQISGPKAAFAVLSIMVFYVLAEPVLLTSRLSEWVATRLETVDANRSAALTNTYGDILIPMIQFLYSRTWLLTLPVAAASVLLWYYVDSGYNSWPQALGGAAPRCAELDINAEELSSRTLDQLGIPADTLIRKKKVRTDQIFIYFAGNEVLMVRERSRANRNDPLLELPRDVVSAIAWCDTAEPLSVGLGSPPQAKSPNP